MRIWLLTSEWNSTGVDDLSRWSRGYAGALAQAGHEVTVFGVDETDARSVEASGPRLVALPPADEAPAIAANALSHWPATSWRLATQIIEYSERGGRPDVIEAQSMYGLPYFLIQRMLTQTTPLASVPIVVNALGSHVRRLAANEGSPYRLPDYWIGRMELFCIRAADAVLCGSQIVECELQDEFGGALPLIRFAPSAWRPFPTTSAPHGRQRTRLYCTLPLERRTGVLGLVDQCAALWSGGAEFELDLNGSAARCPVHNRPLSEIIVERHRRWIEPGLLRIEPGETIAAPGILVFPACGGDFGIACAEARAAGRPVLAARGGDPAALLGEHTPEVFDPGDPESLHSAIRVVDGVLRRAAAGLPVADAIRERIALFESLKDRPPRRSFPTVGVPLRAPPAHAATAAATVAGRLSIVVPHFNLGPFIEETVASIRAAAWPDREIIIVDDGSTDPDSIAAIDRISAADSGVRIIRTANCGPAAARNTGASAATGEFIALVDADDLVEPEFFPRAIDVLRRYDDVGFVYSWVRYFGTGEGVWPAWNAEFPFLLGHNMLTVFIVLRRADYLRFGQQRPDFASDYEDYDGFISMIEAGLKGVALPDPLVRYRIRAASRHRSYHSDQSLHLHRLLTKHHAAAYQRYGTELFNLQLVNGPARFWSNPGSTPFDPLARIAELEKLHRGAWEEGQRIAAAWETQRQHMQAQTARIAELDAAYQAALADGARLSRGWEEQQRHIAELDAHIADCRVEMDRMASDARAELERQKQLSNEYEAEAKRLADAWSVVTAHGAEQAARIIELDAALRASETEVRRVSDGWMAQRAELDKLSARLAEWETRRGWLRLFGRRRSSKQI